MKTWRFRYFGDWDNLRLYDSGMEVVGGVEMEVQGSGAYHGSDVEMVFGNTVGVSGIEDTKEERGMKK